MRNCISFKKPSLVLNPYIIFVLAKTVRLFWTIAPSRIGTKQFKLRMLWPQTEFCSDTISSTETFFKHFIFSLESHPNFFRSKLDLKIDFFGSTFAHVLCGPPRKKSYKIKKGFRKKPNAYCINLFIFNRYVYSTSTYTYLQVC